MVPPGREEVAALRGRLEALDAELDDVRNRASRLDALERERARLEAERAELASRLGPYGRPMALEDLRVASPCRAEWGAMAGDDRVRFCASCEKHVYNFAGMTRDEANALVRANEGGEICVRMFRRDDGTVLTGDCPEGSRRKRRRLALLGAGGGGVVAAAAALWPGAGPPPDVGRVSPAAMGTVAALPLPPPADPGPGAAPRPVEPPAAGLNNVVGRLPIRSRPVAPKGPAAGGDAARPTKAPHAK